MALIEVNSRFCDKGKVVKNGKSPREVQKFYCRSCSKTFQLEYRYNGHKPAVAKTIVEIAINGSGVRDTGRVLKISQHTVIRHLKKIGPSPSY